MPRYQITQTEYGPLLSDRRLLRALAEVARGHDILIYRSPSGSGYQVKISYGSDARDEQVRRQFDEAEFGAWRTLIGALRYALGFHFHREDPDDMPF